MFEKNKALLVIFHMLKNIYIYIYTVYISKHNLNREKQVILLMIPNGVIEYVRTSIQFKYK